MHLLEKLKLRSSLLFPVEAVCLVERFLEFFSSFGSSTTRSAALTYRLSAAAHGDMAAFIEQLKDKWFSYLSYDLCRTRTTKCDGSFVILIS